MHINSPNILIVMAIVILFSPVLFTNFLRLLKLLQLSIDGFIEEELRKEASLEEEIPNGQEIFLKAARGELTKEEYAEFRKYCDEKSEFEERKKIITETSRRMRRFESPFNSGW